MKKKPCSLSLKMLKNVSHRSAENHSQSTVGLQFTVTALFQELMPSIPLEHLEFNRVHSALIRHQPDGPPHDLIMTFLH